jgi:hypothetical protein
MAAKRTIGITIMAVLNILLGLIGFIASCRMLLSGFGVALPSAAPPAATEGLIRGPMVVEFALGRMVVSVGMLIGGVLVMKMSPRGRALSLQFATAWLLLNFVEPYFLQYPYATVLLGSLYPVFVLILFNLPGWKAAFASHAAGTEPQIA